MKSNNNILVVATAEHQKTLNIFDFVTPKCTGVLVTEFSCNMQTQLISWVKTLCDCNLVITTGEWSENQHLFSLVNIARSLQITVIHESNFQKYVEQHNN